MTKRYDDMLRLPHPEPIGRRRMPGRARAAQFAPFAALTGYDSVVREAARLTDSRIELSEDAAQALDAALRQAVEDAGSGREAEFLYFVPDARKDGGRYVSRTGAVRRVDELARTLCLEDGSSIPIDEIIAVRPEDAAP